MEKSEYATVIEQLCMIVGISNWQEIAESQHVVVDGITVGLLYRDDAYEQVSSPSFGDALSLYFDFGSIEIPGIERKLLEINANVDTPSEECFGIHPETSSVVYRALIRLSAENRGEDLVKQIQRFLQRGRSHLHDVLSNVASSLGTFEAPARPANCLHQLA